METKQNIVTWLYIWGEVEQQLKLTGELAPILTGDTSQGSKRGGYSLEDSLLIHASVERGLNWLGIYARGMVTKCYRDGWEWREAEETERWADGTTTTIPTGRYRRTAKAGTIKHHEIRVVRDIERQLAEHLGLCSRRENEAA